MATIVTKQVDYSKQDNSDATTIIVKSSLKTSNVAAEAAAAYASEKALKNYFENSDERLVLNRTYAGYTEYQNGTRGEWSKIRLKRGHSQSRKLSKSIQSDFATLQDSDGGWDSFLLTSYQVGLQEKVQVVATFGDAETVYYFGHQPLQVTFTGMLIDTYDNQWLPKFLTLYDEVLRGTKLAVNSDLVEIYVPGMSFVGSISGITYAKEASRDGDVPFSISMIVKHKEVKARVIPTFDSSWKTNTTSAFTASRDKSSLPTMVTRKKATTTKSASTLQNWTSTVNGWSDSLSSSYSGIYGIFTSITKTVQSTTSDVTELAGAITQPLTDALNVVNSAASTAESVVKSVEKAVNSVTAIPSTITSNINSTISKLKKTKGSITASVTNVATSLKTLVSSGVFKSGKVTLSRGRRRTRSNRAIINK